MEIPHIDVGTAILIIAGGVLLILFAALYALVYKMQAMKRRRIDGNSRFTERFEDEYKLDFKKRGALPPPSEQAD